MSSLDFCLEGKRISKTGRNSEVKIMQGNFGFKNYNWHKSFYFATVHCSFLHGIRHPPSLFGSTKCLSRFET